MIRYLKFLILLFATASLSLGDPPAVTPSSTSPTAADVAGKVSLPWKISGALAFWDLEHVTLASTKVSLFADLTGRGKSLSNSTTAQQGVWTETGVELAGAGYAIDGGGLTNLNFRSMSVVLIMRTYTGSSTYGSPAGMLYQVAAGSPGIYLDAYNSNEYGRPGSVAVLPFAFHPSGGPSLYAACYGSADVTYYNNCGRQVGAVATAGTGSLTRMFSTAASGSGSVLGFVAGGVFDRRLSPSEVQSIARYYGVGPATLTPHLHVMGSSTPAGHLASNYQASVIPKLCAKLGWQMSATGSNGYLMSSQAGVPQASMIPTPGHPNRWLVFMTSNDVAASAPTAGVAGYQTNLTTHLTRIRAADPTGIIIVVDMPPRGGGFTGSGMDKTAYEADRATLNSWVNTNKVALGIDIVVSVNDSPNIGQAADTTNATFYQPDEIHLKDVGHTDLANLIAARVLQYSASNDLPRNILRFHPADPRRIIFGDFGKQRKAA